MLWLCKHIKITTPVHEKAFVVQQGMPGRQLVLVGQKQMGIWVALVGRGVEAEGGGSVRGSHCVEVEGTRPRGWGEVIVVMVVRPGAGEDAGVLLGSCGGGYCSSCREVVPV